MRLFLGSSSTDQAIILFFTVATVLSDLCRLYQMPDREKGPDRYCSGSGASTMPIVCETATRIRSSLNWESLYEIGDLVSLGPPANRMLSPSFRPSSLPSGLGINSDSFFFSYTSDDLACDSRAIISLPRIRLSSNGRAFIASFRANYGTAEYPCIIL